MWEIFEKLCRDMGVRPGTVGRELGISTATLTGWKQGKYTPKMDKMMKIADFFNVPVSYLMTGELEEYYENDETAEIAQKIHDNREMRMLFSAAKDVSPDVLEELYEMLLIIKRRETR